MRKKLSGVILVWIFISSVSLYWSLTTAKSNQDALIRQTAGTLFDLMVVTRRWNSFHNGVYVNVTDQTKPNIYLKDLKRDINCDGIFLTKINPAFMTRQISELTNKKLGIQFHVAGLNPLRPENKPDDWEQKALESFSKNELDEVGERFTTDRGSYFRYMKGLKAKKSCLACHTEKGYALNDIIGGISIKILDPQKTNIFPLVLGHLIIGSIGFIIILVSGLKLIKAYETIHHQAVFDALTNIPNRRYFNDRIVMEVKQTQRQGTPIAILMADIDNFKKYNDFYGHHRGDNVLVLVANAIKSTLKRPVDFCARYGGEEFIIVLPDTDEKGAVHIAKQLINRIQAMKIGHERSDVMNVVTISLGIACETKITSDDKALIKKADKALYQAKSNGKNQYAVFT
ncbi:MAG: diguanylate cyclase [Proteobacteria bacterium]|nr:diguanylate cyclase [Pseudomonadota bacterium]MBU1584639.1 diguanylate cyclase [Pseudomonadota bacterium]MBU2453630.1 diguanylate cyclase [Pseudomonadota bacterium]MBU2630167.1 diguanylate cyclase [Pseudomonadota bacterium]